MGVSVSVQTMVFLGSIGLGALLGLFYDFFRISRVAFSLPAGVILVEDILYFFICATVTFSYMLTTVEGQVRMFVLVGELLGATLYYLTVGSFVMGVAEALVAFLRRLFRRLYRIFVRPVVNLLRRLGRFLGKILTKIQTYFKKQAARARFRLKERRTILYNLLKRPTTASAGAFPKTKNRRHGVLRNALGKKYLGRWKRPHGKTGQSKEGGPTEEI